MNEKMHNKMKISAMMNRAKFDKVAKDEKDDEKLKKTCSDFEAIYLEMTLKTMRSTLPEDSMSNDSFSGDIYQSMHDQYLSEDIAKGRNNIGIGDALYRQLSKKDNIEKK